MERVLASLVAEGTSYLSNLWNSKEDAEANNTGKSASEKCDRERTCTHESGLSTTSSSSRTSTSSSASGKKLSKVMGWMVFGSKMVLNSGKKNNCTTPSLEDATPTQKKTGLDILLAAGSHKPSEPIHLNNLTAVSVVGRGGYGKVMLMQSKTTGKLVAVKEVAKSNLIDKPSSTNSRGIRPVSTKIEHAEMERMVLGIAGDHPFVTSFHGSFQNKDKIFLCLEYVAGGELFGVMQRQGVFSESRVRLYAAEIVCVLAFLHERGIIYRDLKPENILLDSKGHIRLADFGLSIAFNKQGDDSLMRCYSICGTPEYVSPDIVLGATSRKNDSSWSYGKTVDWWALGVLTYEMLYRVPPFFHRDRKTMLNKILECSLQFPKQPQPKMPPVSQAANDFIAALLKFEEQDRLGYGNQGSQNVKAHAFFDSLDWDRVAAGETLAEYIPEIKGPIDTSNFDPSFTKEVLREDTCSRCAYNLELTGYEYLPEEFSESMWYDVENTTTTKNLSNM